MEKPQTLAKVSIEKKTVSCNECRVPSPQSFSAPAC